VVAGSIPAAPTRINQLGQTASSQTPQVRDEELEVDVARVSQSQGELSDGRLSVLTTRHTGNDPAPMRRLSEITFQIRISCESFEALLWMVEPHSAPWGRDVRVIIYGNGE
jgi:hypothetical protein